jgi:Ni/Co efflux regulator RcnB
MKKLISAVVMISFLFAGAASGQDAAQPQSEGINANGSGSNQQQSPKKHHHHKGKHHKKHHRKK